MANRTEQQWTALFDATVTAILNGILSNYSLRNNLDNPSHPSDTRDNLKKYENYRNRDNRRPRRSKRLMNPKTKGVKNEEHTVMNPRGN